MLSLLGSGETRALSSFDRSAALLLNILLLFVPLLGLAIGAQLIAGDRENGALLYLMSQPLTKRQLFFGKALGAVFALIMTLSVGFSVAAVGIAFGGGSRGVGGFLALWAGAILFVFVCVSLGMIISVLAGNRSRAIGISLLSWFLMTILSDLGLMGTAYVLRLRSEGIVGLVMVNPVESFKILVIRLMADNLESLGTGGVYLDFFLGKSLPLVLIGLLILTASASFGGAYWLFSQQEEA
jgi:Cu-processing system permease protein